jgi:polyhydroxyalkanoate synthase
MSRAAGPHPLPLFLSAVTRATGGDRARLAAVLDGVRRYQAAPRPEPAPPRPVVAQAGGTTLRDYGGSGLPVVFVPSLINSPAVLAMPGERSLLDWLAAQGLRPLLVDWGAPDAAARRLTFAGHVTERLLPLLAALGEPVALAGYCLGGTMALAAAALAPERVRRLVLIAAPWRFAGYPDDRRRALAGYWAGVAPLAAPLGVLPMDMLQPAFWALDEAMLAAKFARFATLPDGPDADAFVALEDWANTGPPLPLPAAEELAEAFFRDDQPGRGGWRVGGQAIAPEALAMPVLDIVSRTDRIVPADAAAGMGERLDIASGHVGMIIGSRSRTELWEPLARWLHA